jgi:glycosyltransferase involved in cell wall biosynthesis
MLSGKSSMLIISTCPFPNGLASTNRIIGYCKGFLKNDVDVKVIILFPTEKQNAIVNKEAKGVYQGISFQYASNTTVKRSSKTYHLLQLLISLFRIISIIYYEKKNSKINTIIFYTKELSLTYFFFILTRIYKINFIKEESESPEVYFKNARILKSLYGKLYLQSYFLFDGCLVMTRHIEEYLLKLKIPANKLVHVPQTVEFERFQTSIKNNSLLESITYCGLLNQEKDGVLDLIKAFAIVSELHPKLELRLIGEASNSVENNKINILFDKLKIIEKITITGLKHRDEIPELLNRSSILVMPRPKSHQSDYGFPTKLVEYLSTGIPVIATKVGEIPDYLTDKQDAFLVEPGDIQALSNAISYVLDHRDEANSVGMRGRDLVKKEFNYVRQTNKIIAFMERLKKVS